MADDTDQQLREIEESAYAPAVPPASREAAFQKLWPLLAIGEPKARSRAWKLLNECIRREAGPRWMEGSKLRRLEELSRRVPTLPAGAAMDVFKFCLDATYPNDDEAIHDRLAHWIRRIRSSGGMPDDIGLACEYVVFVPYDRAELERHLRHPHANLRAAASYRLAHMPIDFPRLPNLIQEIEIQLGAVAGPFLGVWAYYKFEELPFDSQEWILQILERRRLEGAPDEPPTIFFSLHSCACEMLAPERKTIERLLAADAVEICRHVVYDFVNAGDPPGMTASEAAEWKEIYPEVLRKKEVRPETLLRLGSFWDARVKRAHGA